MEPLTTDEKLDKPLKRERDMDSQMLFGCSGFVLASFATYFIAVWPFFVWLEIERLPVLGLALTTGFSAAFLVGIFLTFKFELAGAAGFVGGMVAASIFLYLRFQQAFLEAEAQRTQLPYPQSVQWILPLLFLSFSVLISAVVLAILASREERAKKV